MDEEKESLLNLEAWLAENNPLRFEEEQRQIKLARLKAELSEFEKWILEDRGVKQVYGACCLPGCEYLPEE